MLKINMADVLAVVHSLIPYLIAAGILLLVAVIITVTVNKKTVKNIGSRKLIHSQSWIIALTGLVIALSLMMTGPMATLLNNASVKKYALSKETVTAANKLAGKTEQEAISLLKNEDQQLPLKNNKINVFGWSSTNPIYGGQGSGSMSEQYPTVSMLQGLSKAGFKTNGELSKFYNGFKKSRGEIGIFKCDWTLPEIPVDQYPNQLIENAKGFSDQAVIVIARPGGEGADLPKDMRDKSVVYKNNSKNYPDFKEGQHYLQLNQTERDMLDLVTKNFSKVTLIYNGGNPIQFDFLNDYPQIKSVLWCPPAGQTGFTALGNILAGKVNPSGKTPDTLVKNIKESPAWNNYGDFAYNNVDNFKMKNAFTKMDIKPHFINYSENIYVGYKFYETAAKEGVINYDNLVAYPFGYGLSYTTFHEEMGEINHHNDEIELTVTVTNTGNTPGKDVVEIYFEPPYTDGGTEKASTNLIAFSKTKELKAGESQNLKLSFKDSDMASYDANNAKAYVLDQGKYVIHLQTDSHTVVDSKPVTINKQVIYNEKDRSHNNDKTPATNQFDDARGEVTYLSRAGHFANLHEATAAPKSMSMSDQVKAKFINNGNYDPKKYNNSNDKNPTMSANNGIKLVDLRGKSYDDPAWNKLLDELSFKDMDSLIAKGGYGTPAIQSIGKVQLVDADGPAALNNNFTKMGSIGFPSAISMASTWNKDLAAEFGHMVGQMAREMHISGWYAPSMNIHRTSLGGRNFEYFSEDGFLSGSLASQEIAQVQKQGVYAFMKHFALNDQETNRLNMLCTWASEQSIREIYLKPFEMSVKNGKATGAMSSFNYIGPVYSGANPHLLQKVLRDEWGFRGFVVTDYYGSSDIFQNSDQCIRNGNDTMLATVDGNNHVSDHSATSAIAMRKASHNILYTTVNSWVYEHGQPKTDVPTWRIIMYTVWGVTIILVLVMEYLSLRRFYDRRNRISAK